MYYKKLYLQDIGNLPTISDRKIKKNFIFRSNDLNRISNEEYELLRSKKIQHIIDLRQEKIVYKYPDKYVTEVVTHLPVHSAEFKDVTVLKVFLRKVDWESYNLDNLYIELLESNKELFKKFFKALIKRPKPVLIHCTAGKDRAGVFSAIFQSSLGIDSSLILNSYMKIRPHLRKNLNFYLKLLSTITPLPEIALSVKEDNIVNLLNYIKNKYGGTREFLKVIGFSEFDELERLFLEEKEP